MSDSAVELEGVEIRYGRDVVAVRDVSLCVARGTVHVLLGRSGSGKTTLLRAIAGFEPIASGRVVLGGREVDTGRGGRWVPPEDRGVGFVFQDYALFPHLTVAKNVAFGMARRDAAAVDGLLAQVGLSGLGGRRPSELSGGEQQRVALARALAQKPALMLLDEPFSNLDKDLRRRVREETAALLREAGVTAIYVTHDAEEAFSLGDALSVLHRGRLEQTAAPRALYQAPASVTVARLTGAANVLPAQRTDAGRVRCALGELEACGGAVDAGAALAVVVRPEQLRVAGEGEAGVAARVLRRRFLGPLDEVELALDDGTALVARFAPEATPGEPGAALRVAVSGAVAAVAPRDGD